MNKTIQPSVRKESNTTPDNAEFDRVLKRIEQGASTIYDARFIREFVASISHRVVNGSHS